MMPPKILFEGGDCKCDDEACGVINSMFAEGAKGKTMRALMRHGNKFKKGE